MFCGPNRRSSNVVDIGEMSKMVCSPCRSATLLELAKISVKKWCVVLAEVQTF